MIELRGDALVFSFPEVHRDAVLRVQFQRTLRIPDDGRDYPLPPGLGGFPLRHVDDFAARLPSSWLRRGGVMLPMYQSEALWLSFSSRAGYPFAVKVATGKVNAVSGGAWDERLHRRPQDYVVVPEQPWLDGYCVEEGVIRQFVAMPLGAGYTAEEQLTGRAEHGGLRILACPIAAEVYERSRQQRSRIQEAMPLMASAAADMDMGLAPGGRMRQHIYDDPHGARDWETGHLSRCFVHLANALVWRAVTGEQPPTAPRTAADYTRAGLPWFEYYAGLDAVDGSSVLARLESVLAIARRKGDVPLPENESFDPERVIELRGGLARDQVREGAS